MQVLIGTMRVWPMTDRAGARAASHGAPDRRNPIHRFAHLSRCWAVALFSAARAAAQFLWLNATAIEKGRRHSWRWALFLFVDDLLFAAPNGTERHGTLVVLMSRLGDAIVSAPLVEALRKRSAEAGERFTVLGEHNWEVLSGNIYSGIETRFIHARRFRFDLLYRLRVLRWVRGQDYRQVICFMHHRAAMREDAIVALSGAGERIVAELPFLQSDDWIFRRYLARMTLVARQPEQNGADEIFDAERGAFRKVPHIFDRQRHFYELVSNGGALHWPRIRARGAVPARRPYAVLAVGASEPERRWSLPAYVNLAVRIARAGYGVVFVGGPGEAEYKDELLRLLEMHRRNDDPAWDVSVLIDELPFSALIRVYSEAACFIGADSGGSHLALWLGTPTVTVLQVDPSSEMHRRMGDYFPYPDGVLDAPCRTIWLTPAEFRRVGGCDDGDRVWDAVWSLMAMRSPSGPHSAGEAD